MEFRSGFKGGFNFHLGTKWTSSKVASSLSNTNTNNLSFLDVQWALNEKVRFELNSERYFFDNINNNGSEYYFLDIEGKYNYKPNKLSFTLSGKNLFNTQRFRSVFISDIGTSVSEYRLLPRYVLLKVKYRF